MQNIRETVLHEIEKNWPKAKKNISKLNKDISKLLKTSEENLVHISKNVQRGTEKLIAKARREELYYELGKTIAPLLTSDQLKNKNVMRIYSQFQQIHKALRKK